MFRALEFHHVQHYFARSWRENRFKPSREVDQWKVNRNSDRDSPQNYEYHNAQYCAVKEEDTYEATEHERALETRGISKMRHPAYLFSCFVKLVDPGNGEWLVDPEQDHDVVGQVVVNDVGEVVAHVGAEGQTAHDAHQADPELDMPLLHALVREVHLVLDHGCDCFQDREAAVHAQWLQREEQDEAPEVFLVQVVQCRRLGGEC